MQFLIDFLENEDIQKTKIFDKIKCTQEEAEVLRHLTKAYIEGIEDYLVINILKEVFDTKDFAYLKKLDVIKNLLRSGWLIQNELHQLKMSEVGNLEILNSSLSLNASFLKLLEKGTFELELPDVAEYTDHLEYLKDQFLKIDIYRKISTLKQSFDDRSPGVIRLKNRLTRIEEQIKARLEITKSEILVEKMFQENELNEKEQVIFLALLKEDYSGDIDSLRDMNTLIDLISFDEYDKIRNRALLEDGSKLIESGLIDYDEMFTAFGSVARSFFLSEDVLKQIMHPDKEQKKEKMQLSTVVKEQDMFELIEPKTSLDDVVLHQTTLQTLQTVQKQMDRKVIKKLKDWGIKQNSSINAKIIFYGAPGTGKTMTALSLAKTLKKKVLSFDCSKILSMYVGESEKNVRAIFDKYKEITQNIKNEPVLLLNEADQFLSSRTEQASGSADKMHNQMQNIFLEQIERFNGVLIATTNFIDGIDKAFSRRFDHKIEFKKPTKPQRRLLWQKMLPSEADFEEDFDIEKLIDYPLTGAQIELVIKNTAFKVAIKEESIFTMEDFKTVVEKEVKSNFDSEKTMGFI
jgi:SpoVK/Ycf46/Vps4 family AAA+-type ATPase